MLESSGPDVTPPIVERAVGARRAGRIIVTFSEAMGSQSAEKTANYRIDKGIRIAGATLIADGRAVTLQTSALTAGATYALDIRGVRDLAGNAIAPDTRVALVVPDAADGAEQGLVAAYNFDEGEGSVVHDSSGAERPPTR